MAWILENLEFLYTWFWIIFILTMNKRISLKSKLFLFFVITIRQKRKLDKVSQRRRLHRCWWQIWTFWLPTSPFINRLNSRTFRIFELSAWNFNLNNSDCRASKINSDDTKPEPISWELNLQNLYFLTFGWAFE